MLIDLFDDTDTLTKEHIQLLENILAFTAKKEKLNNEAELSVRIVTNEAIKEMNHMYRNKNEPTDVLSFPMDNPLEIIENDIHSIPVILGDIIISVDKVHEQSLRYNHSFERELSFLAIHGLLHLLGYTHDDQVSEKIMFQKQDAILEEFNLGRE